MNIRYTYINPHLHHCWISSPVKLSLLSAPVTECAGRVSPLPMVQIAWVRTSRGWGFEGAPASSRAPQMQGRRALGCLHSPLSTTL